MFLGQDWPEAEPFVRRWAAGAPVRTYHRQDLDARRDRAYPALDSLILAESYRRAGIEHPRLRKFPPAPKEGGRICGERYIFYLRGNRILGVEYREIVSNGVGGYRQRDDAIGELPAVPSSSG